MELSTTAIFSVFAGRIFGSSRQWRSQKFVMEGVQNLVGVGVSGGVFLPENPRQNFAWPNLIFIARLNNKFMHIANLIGNR